MSEKNQLNFLRLRFVEARLEFAEGGVNFAEGGVEFAIGWCSKKIAFSLLFFGPALN